MPTPRSYQLQNLHQGYTDQNEIETTGSGSSPNRKSCRRAWTTFSDIVGQIWTLKGPIMVVVAFTSTLPLLLVSDSPQGRCAYVLLTMALLWVTEALPIPVTALVPVVLFPALEILTPVEVANSYCGNTSLLFMGGLMVAIAVEESGLHRRVALSVMNLVGSDPKWVMLGLMLPTWFLSMWISNTATASMMLPIVHAILAQLKIATGRRSSSTETESGTNSNNRSSSSNLTNGSNPTLANGSNNIITSDSNNDINSAGDSRLKKSASNDVTASGDVMTNGGDAEKGGGVDVGGVNPKGKDRDSFDSVVDRQVSFSLDKGDDEIDDVSRDPVEESDVIHERLTKGLLLAIAYAANTGGIATLTGTPPNLVFEGQARKYFEDYGGEADVSYLRWMMMALPLSLLMLFLCWLWLVIVFLRGACRRQPQAISNAVKHVMQSEYKRLGKISFAEIMTLCCFLMVALLWLTREPQFVKGWGDLFPTGYMSDSQSAILVSLLFFVLPARAPTIFCWRYRNGIRQTPSYTPLLTWEVAQAKMPWGVIVLLGGGFALAKGCRESGLSDWFGEQLASFQGLDPWIINLIITIAVAMATEITSNTATATLLMPIMAELALRLQVNPLYFMSSAALATSFAFMMPVATPPNAIVFSHGNLKISDMAAAGSVMNVIAVVCLSLAVNTWGDAIFDFRTMPDIFRVNVTGTAAS